MKTRLIVCIIAVLFTSNIYSQNPNFYIYLCFGQSNMEGQGPIESQDRTVNSRFKVMETLDCSNLSRTKGTWYTAVPPTCRCYTKLSPADYFGRTMVANLPDSITVGIINVSVGGCNIGLFDKINYAAYDSTYTDTWFQDIIKSYNGNPYQYLIDIAKLAQKDGVIKGILLHQGETNTGDAQWPTKVKTIYNDLLSDLSLSADSVPLLAGEVVSSQYNGCCSSMNSIIDQLPNTIPTAHVISSSACSVQSDKAHFTSDGYRKLGRRYAVAMLNILGYKSVSAEAECGIVGGNWTIKADNSASNASYISALSSVENLSTAPTNDSSVVQMSFTLSSDTSYYIYGRFNNPNIKSKSYWVKIDNGAYELIDNLTTTGWQWLKIKSINLTAGTHKIYVGIADSGTTIDKILIKNSQILPVSIAEEASNVCVPVISTMGNNQTSLVTGYVLEQNYPNPCTESTNIAFEIPNTCYISLKVYNSQGIEVAELAGKEFNAGRNIVQCNLKKLSAGNYFYTIKADKFTATKNLIILKK